MPNVLDHVPRDAYAANLALGERETRNLPGGMRLARVSARQVELTYRGSPVCRWSPDGELLLYPPIVGRTYRGTPIPTRGLYDRIRRVLPVRWALEARPASRRYGSRYPYIVFDGGYRYPLEQECHFLPDGSVRWAYGGRMPLADLELAAYTQCHGEQPRRLPEQRDLPAWVGRGEPGEPQVAAYAQAVEGAAVVGAGEPVTFEDAATATVDWAEWVFPLDLEA